jgi:hypothetical protein
MDANGNPLAVGTPSQPAQAAITKILKMPIGTTDPELKFTYTFTPLEVDEEAYVASPANMPPIGPIYIDFGDADGFDEEYLNAAGDTKNLVKESSNIVAGINWPHAGIYAYNVKEEKIVTPALDADTQEVTYSKAEYSVTVYVDNYDNNGVDSLYVKYIEARIVVNDNFNEGESPDKKVDPTPGGDPTYDFKHSHMVFTNIYVKTKIGDLENPALKISKTVAGDSPSYSKYFEFKATLTLPSVIVPDPNEPSKVYYAYVVENGAALTTIGTEITATTNVDKSGANDAIMFPTGASVTFNLKHGQYLAFIEAEVGTKFAVTETGTTHYTPSYVLTCYGSNSVSLTAPQAGDPLSIPDPSYLADINNVAAYTNTRKIETPTGISVDNLPYIVLVALAGIALVGYIVIKSRKNKEYDM